MERNSLVTKSYVWGKNDDWEGICTTLDIATQGVSLQDVGKSLQNAVEDYFEELIDLHPHERKKLLNRKSPLRLRLFLHIRYLLSKYTKVKAGSTNMQIQVYSV